jgi:hypothetical protein
VDLVDKPTVGTSCGSFALRQTLVPVFTRRVSTRSTSSFQLNMPHQSSPLIHHLSLQDSDFCSHYIPGKEHRVQGEGSKLRCSDTVYPKEEAGGCFLEQ